MAQNNETVEKTSAREEVLRGNGQGTDNDETASISVRHLMMKVDFRVMPWLVVLFVLSFLDK